MGTRVNRKRTGIVCLSLLLWLLLFLLLLPAGGRAEGTEAAAEADSPSASPVYYDCTGDQSRYSALVAALGRGEIPAQQNPKQKQSIDGARGQKNGQTLTAVLCRTDGTEPDFSSWEPAYVLAGPCDCYTLYFSEETAADEAVSGLSALAGIRYAERDQAVEACGTSTVSFRSWGARTMNYGTYLDWASGSSEGRVMVAVVDSGVYPHEMYASRMPESGYDYIDGDADATNDPYGHGTNVTGILADCTQGFPVYIYPIRVLDASGGGSVTNTVNGIREAMNKGVDVINMSLVTKNGVSTALDQAVLDALSAGITVVAAAGNNATDTSWVSPAHLTDAGVLIVGALSTSGTVARYSNYGSSVDVYVYGSSIYCCSNSGGYTTNSGTSMSAPHVAGLASLLILTHNGITPAEIESRIMNSTDLSVAIRIPDLLRITPNNPGFSFTQLKMDLQDSYQLSTQIRPLTAMEAVSYTSSDETVVTVPDGLLTPVSAGTATVTAHSRGLEDMMFTVTVTDRDCTALSLPLKINMIEAESFSNNSALTHVIIHDGCETIGEDAFDACDSLMTVEIPSSVIEMENNSFSGAVLLCPEDDTLIAYIIRLQLPYLIH